MVRMIFSLFPFVVCLCWFTTFALHTSRNDSAQRMLTWFLATCSVLYLCHALYFNDVRSLELQSLWTLCSLSVYPLYYIYICQLTCRPLSVREKVVWLIPGAVVAALILLWSEHDADNIRKVLNTAQIALVLFLGLRHLTAFDREIAEVYADTERHDTSSVRMLLIAFVVTSVFSVVCNIAGRQFFDSNDWLLYIALTPFAVLLFLLSYIGFTRDFSTEQHAEDISDYIIDSERIEDHDYSFLWQQIEEVMKGKEIFLRKNLKVTDVALELHSCRTYVSACINKHAGCSFSEYINRQRIDYA